MSNPFRFKQFTVDQAGCAMKINTDGVLLGALAQSQEPKAILDIGTGTGVVALMLAQRFADATVEAVDIDVQAAATAQKNFSGSPFSNRLISYHAHFEEYFLQFPDKKFDLIVSNPPFFINSLHNPNHKKKIARHTDKNFFETLLALCAAHLSPSGLLWLILPLTTVELIERLALNNGLYASYIFRISSFKDQPAHRNIIAFSKQSVVSVITDFVIYEQEQKYSDQYQSTLKPFFTIF